VNDLVLWLSIAALFLGALALFLGLRGRRIDREPRCPARKCKYALGSVISARSAQSEEPFPLTCPECGRTITAERALRVGTRRRIKPALALAIALLVPGVTILGFAGYLRWQNTQPLAAMPLWLLLRQAYTDTSANNWAHQREIRRRAQAGLIAGDNAQRVINSVLEWQLDPNVNIEVIADALTPLHQQGQLSQEQIERYWDQIKTFELRVRGPAVPGEILPLEVRVRFRGGRMSNAPLPRDINYNGADRNFVIGFMGLEIEEMRIGDAVVSLPPDARKMHTQMDPAPDTNIRDSAWRTHMDDAWDHIRVPDDASGAVDVRLRLRWSMSHPIAHEVAIGTERTLQELLAQAGIPTTGFVELSERVAVGRERGPVRVVNDPIAREWLETQLRSALLNLDPQRIDRNSFTILRFPLPTWKTELPASDTFLFGDIAFRCQGREFGPLYIETHPGARHLIATALPASTASAMLDLVRSDPEGWEIVFTPRPERAATRVDDIEVLGGEPIIAPLRILTGTTRQAIDILQSERDTTPLPRR
jgi:hypothetical protein